MDARPSAPPFSFSSPSTHGRGRQLGSRPACPGSPGCGAGVADGGSPPGCGRRAPTARCAQRTSGGEFPGRSSTCLLLSDFSTGRGCGIQPMPMAVTAMRLLSLSGAGSGRKSGVCAGPPRGRPLPVAERPGYQASVTAERRGPFGMSVKCVIACLLPAVAGPPSGPTSKQSIVDLPAGGVNPSRPAARP